MTMVKIKPRHKKLAQNHAPFLNENGMSRVAMGAAAGCLIGATAALLLAPKQARHRFTQGLDNIYDQVADLADEYTHGALEKGQQAFKNAKNASTHLFSRRESNSNRNLILGILGAGILGASAAYALHQRSPHLKETLAEKWRLGKWTDMAKLIVDTVSNKLQEEGEPLLRKGEHNPIQNAIHWATMGLNLWREIQKRR